MNTVYVQLTKQMFNSTSFKPTDTTEVTGEQNIRFQFHSIPNGRAMSVVLKLDYSLLRFPGNSTLEANQKPLVSVLAASSSRLLCLLGFWMGYFWW